jgi:hypothetical protein
MARKINRLNARAVATIRSTAAMLMVVAFTFRFQRTAVDVGCSYIGGARTE